MYPYWHGSSASNLLRDNFKRSLKDLRSEVNSVLSLLVGTPSANRPELASRRAEHSLPYADVTILYIFEIMFYLCFMCIDLITSPLGVTVGLLSI